MNHKFGRALVFSLLVSSACNAQPTENQDKEFDLTPLGKFYGDIRLRFESVDDDTPLKDADALTVRSRIGFESDTYRGFSALIEMEDISVVGPYDDYAPESPGYSVVADPEETELNRAYIKYSGIEGLSLAIGRQRLIFDNARFIGNVGWRQNEQTFDSATLSWAATPKLTIDYAYINEVHGITKAFDAETDDHLVHLTWSGFRLGSITAYSYLLDNRDTDAESDTFGIRLSGDQKREKVKFLYTAEYAHQSAKPAEREFDVDYWLLEGGVSIAGVTGKLGYEVLSSDDGAYGFQTPYATKHAFNGWADRFLVTPANGLEDLYFSLSGSLAKVKLLAVAHTYRADNGSDDYGDELDLLASISFLKRFTVGLKYAYYDAESFSVDTQKLAVWTQVKF